MLFCIREKHGVRAQFFQFLFLPHPIGVAFVIIPREEAVEGTPAPFHDARGVVLYGHDLVDFVTQESQIAGKGAAQYIDGLRHEGVIKTRGQNGVRYTVPQSINLDEKEDVKIYFRVGNVYHDKRVVVTCGDKVLFNRKKIKLAPGEMENVIIKAADIAEMTADQEIVVSIEEA